MGIEKSRLKLYAVGTREADPEKWSIWSEIAFVIARTPKEARRLADVPDDEHVVEIPLDRPKYLSKMPEPSWRGDI